MIPGASREFGRIAAMDREEDLTDEIVMLRSVIREVSLLERAAETRLREVRRAGLVARLRIVLGRTNEKEAVEIVKE